MPMYFVLHEAFAPLNTHNVVELACHPLRLSIVAQMRFARQPSVMATATRISAGRHESWMSLCIDMMLMHQYVLVS